MLVTKTEFKEKFGYKDLANVSYFIRKGTIVVNDGGLIDLDNRTNKKFIKARQEKLTNQKNTQTVEQEPETKTDNQIHLDINELNHKILSNQLAEKRATLLELRIKKEAKELIEVEVMEKVMMLIYDSLFQNILEAPSAYVDDIQNIFKVDKNPKETFIKFFTEKLTSQLQSSIDIAGNKARKLYE